MACTRRAGILRDMALTNKAKKVQATNKLWAALHACKDVRVEYKEIGSIFARFLYAQGETQGREELRAAEQLAPKARVAKAQPIKVQPFNGMVGGVKFSHVCRHAKADSHSVADLHEVHGQQVLLCEKCWLKVDCGASVQLTRAAKAGQ